MLAGCLHSALARRPLGMGTVIDVPDAGKAYSYPGPRAFGNLRPEANEEGFNICPRNVGPCRLPEGSFEGMMALCVHVVIILWNGTNAMYFSLTGHGRPQAAHPKREAKEE